MRPPRTLPPLTLFHDAASPLSRALLARLPALLSPSAAPSSPQAQTQTQARLGPAEAYLQRARDGEAPLAELEVRSKLTEPPTETQWRLIRQYAAAQRIGSAPPGASSEPLAPQHEPAAAAAAAPLRDGDTHKAVQGSPASVPDGKVRARLMNAKREHAERTALAANAGAAAEQEPIDAGTADEELPLRLRDGPLLVHWDAGLVAMDERGVEQILRALRGEDKRQEPASWCVVL